MSPFITSPAEITTNIITTAASYEGTVVDLIVVADTLRIFAGDHGLGAESVRP
jgi:hypothetical protein